MTYRRLVGERLKARKESYEPIKNETLPWNFGYHFWNSRTCLE